MLRNSRQPSQVTALLLWFCVFLFCNLSLIIWRKFDASSLIVDQLRVISIAIGCGIGVLSGFRRIAGVLKRIGFPRSLVLWVSISALSSFVLYGLAVPGAIQRSKSAHVILWVGESGNGTTKAALRLQLERKFGEMDFASIETRLAEQKSRGLLNDADGVYTATIIGRSVFKLANFLSGIYSLPGWQKASLLNSSIG